MERREKTVAQSRTEQSRIVMPGDTNGTGRLFGGRLMEWIDVVAGVVGRRHSNRDIITAYISDLQFLSSARANDTVLLVGQITYVGRTSMEVRVDTFVEKLNGKKDLANRAYLTLVALDENDRPTEVPRLILNTQEERQEWEAGEARADYRKMNRVVKK